MDLMRDPVLRDLWRDIERSSQELAIKNAKADPEKHKLSRIIADNKPASYTYWAEPRTKKRRAKWCVSNYPNIAGYYLSWRQIETKRMVKRTQWKAHKHQYLGENRCREKAK